tara:strand:- start:473 stop:640 length:168 start_codon:yes stop_codon:yes gene_type:complete
MGIMLSNMIIAYHYLNKYDSNKKDKINKNYNIQNESIHEKFIDDSDSEDTNLKNE